MIVRVRQSLLRSTMLVSVVGATFMFVRDAAAADQASVFTPNFAAVDGFNGKAEAFAGSLAFDPARRILRRSD